MWVREVPGGWKAIAHLVVHRRGVTADGIQLIPGGPHARSGGGRSRLGKNSASIGCHPTARPCDFRWTRRRPSGCTRSDDCPLPMCQLAAPPHETGEEALACAEAAIPRLLQEYDEERQRWAERQRERSRAQVARRAARMGPKPDRVRQQMLAEEPTCRLCGAPTTDVDHILPLVAGGKHVRENLQGLCRPCHLEKSRQEREEGRYKTPRRSR